MRNLNILPLALLLSMLILGCDNDNEIIQTSILKMKWIESFEEKTSEEIEIYRPGDYDDFPASRYRQVFIFDDNGEIEYSVLATNDAHYMAKGSWEYNEKTKILKIYNSDSEKIYEFEIIELTNQVLKLKANN
ncbi:hypothetical protein [Algoriphagus sp. NG3]|uniref:hypothetical protein n=1 Tax=Algoriphagus sp. NG3 TaxID=3097546 RepID=UPI002A7F2347|nr:hypothetical protein [Algoriphagus sp. NG3]WPR74067.1 hypothetical protein SLW71_15455 [Algoriphagus sp. NG3]